MPGNLLVFI